MKLVKELLVMRAIAAVAVGAAVVVWQREPWVSEREREHEWIKSYAAWRATVEVGGTQRESCATSLDRAAGSPPTQRTRVARRAAVDGGPLDLHPGDRRLALEREEAASRPPLRMVR